MQRDLSFASLGTCPANGVVNDSLDLWIVIDRVSLVTGTEVKNASAPARPAVPTPKDFPALEPGDEHLFVRDRDSERFAIHFGFLQFDVIPNSFRDGMAWINI